MNKTCAGPGCGKTVYPVEEFQCLDKVWHKDCFKCDMCHMKLTINTYKGYNKVPYCNAHYPTTKFTAVADTPEARRLKDKAKEKGLIGYPEHAKMKEKEYHKKFEVADNLNRNPTGPSDLRYGAAPPEEYSGQGQQYNPPQQMDSPPPESLQEQTPSSGAGKGPVMVALYDYTAADDDEVSFMEGDLIEDCETIDNGWMTGKVQRTGEQGMLPSNYLEEN